MLTTVPPLRELIALFVVNVLVNHMNFLLLTSRAFQEPKIGRIRNVVQEDMQDMKNNRHIAPRDHRSLRALAFFAFDIRCLTCASFRSCLLS